MVMMISTFYIVSTSLVLVAAIVYLLWRIFENKSKRLLLDTINQLKESDLQNKNTLFDESASVKEVRLLNHELNLLSDKVFEEYQGQKMFTENINHELMTPLAIIRGKLELIIQSENLKENDLKLVSDIFIVIDRLTKLNKSLILLSKIDNNQFEEKSTISITSMIDEILDSYEDQIRVKEMKIRKQNNTSLIIYGNEMLFYILFSNLIKNAIFHNLNLEGYISIIINQNQIHITNSISGQILLQDNIFERFIKHSDSEDSVGLGLSIVKKICELYQINVHVKQSNQSYTFSLNFNEAIIR